MKKKAVVTQRAPLTKAKPGDLHTLVAEVRHLIQSARHAAAAVVNTLQVRTNFEIGRRIVEHEQRGRMRAEYGKQVIRELSATLADEFGRGFSISNLQLMRQFFLEFNDRIHQTPFGESATTRKHQTLSGELVARKKSQTPSDQLAIHQTLSGKLTRV